jgi:hypothetical protein
LSFNCHAYFLKVTITNTLSIYLQCFFSLENKLKVEQDRIKYKYKFWWKNLNWAFILTVNDNVSCSIFNRNLISMPWPESYFNISKNISDIFNFQVFFCSSKYTYQIYWWSKLSKSKSLMLIGGELGSPDSSRLIGCSSWPRWWPGPWAARGCWTANQPGRVRTAKLSTNQHQRFWFRQLGPPIDLISIFTWTKKYLKIKNIRYIFWDIKVRFWSWHWN